MVPKKAPILTLDAFRQAAASNPSLGLDYVGSGLLLQDAIRFVGEFGMQKAVTLHGGKPHSFVQRLMENGDIFVQHSITDPDDGDEEGLPVAILEAMASGLPVVATRHAGIPEAVEDGVTGFLVEEGDIQSMKDKILLLAQDCKLRHAMGAAGWDRARNRFSWSRERINLLQALQLQELDA
jgi:glycosyltransferase involved in cell wall biosynthesis